VERKTKAAKKRLKYGIDADVTVGDDWEVTNAIINNPSGGQVDNKLQLPDRFPVDVPIPSDCTVMATSPAPGGFMVNAMTDATADETLAGVRGKLTAAGWTETVSQPNAMMAEVGFVTEADGYRRCTQQCLTGNFLKPAVDYHPSG